LHPLGRSWKRSYFSTFKGFKRSSTQRKIFCHAFKERKKHSSISTEGFYRWRLKLRRYQMTKSLPKLSKPYVRGLCIVI
jgi:hypothetical protein